MMQMHFTTAARLPAAEKRSKDFLPLRCRAACGR